MELEYKDFKVFSEYQPAGDQPTAIKELSDGLENNLRDQVLLGITGSGKTFTMAKIIEKLNRPALIMAHNKTLAAQLYSEMKSFFPENAVEYFVSYYDYYQPEAYIPRTDTYIEKDASINERIDLLRHSATRSLLERKDVIVVSSVSCIYGLGSPELYSEMVVVLKRGMRMNRQDLIQNLVRIQYERNDLNFIRGKFRVRGDIVDIFPAHYSEIAWRVEFFGDEIENITEFDPLTGHITNKLRQAIIYANSHFVTPEERLREAIVEIEQELELRLNQFQSQNNILEAERLKQRVNFDLEMIRETGTCKGIENYSRFLSGRPIGSPPPTLFEYLPKNALLFVDESHVTVPQVGGMFNGDRARKSVLVEHGFRLPSALDNRPLKFEEWEAMRPQTIFVSATPGKYEMIATNGKFTEQIIRPTGLLDPECIIRPASNQVDDLLNECRETVMKGMRVLVTTLTKKMAENLCEYLKDLGLKVVFLHSEVLTLERVEIIEKLRQGEHEILVGVNLLREGLDIPECGLVAILDADKQGFLRSETSLIQTIGRAARNNSGKAILYADKETDAIKSAIAITAKRREIQEKHNTENNITPTTVSTRSLISPLKVVELEQEQGIKQLSFEQIDKLIDKTRKEMLQYAANLDFEKAAELRDKIKKLEELELKS